MALSCNSAQTSPGEKEENFFVKIEIVYNNAVMLKEEEVISWVNLGLE